MRNDEMTADDVAEEIQRQRESEAGKALAQFGFIPSEQGGGLVNFSRPVVCSNSSPTLCRDGCREHVVSGVDLDGWGPLTLAEPVILVHDDASETHFTSLSAFLATLPSPWLSERLISRLSPLRRANLERRIRNHAVDAMQGCDACGTITHRGSTPHVARLERMAGRVAMLISNAELRERSARHG